MPTPSRLVIRREAAADRDAVRNVVKAAFGRRAEADLVDALRAEGHARVSLVAEEDGAVVGHLMLSTMEAPFRALGLAPLAVFPARQGRGVAGQLVRAAVMAARNDGCEAIFVLGDPGFYGRFGFSAEAAAGFDSPYAGPFLMALMLCGADPPRRGAIAYARPFNDIA